MSIKRFPSQPHRFLLRSKAGIGLVGFGVVVGLVASVVPTPSAIAIPSPFPRVDDITPSTRDYSRCTSKLLDLKLPAEEAASACARALKPGELAQCVSKVGKVNGIAAADALEACRRVRRPGEMASCVVDIRRRVDGAAAPDILDYCRNSLLPERFAKCVVGTHQAAKSTPTQAMDTCIDGSYFPRQVDPTFIRYPLPPDEPTTPSMEPSPTFTPAPVLNPPASTPQSPANVTPQKF